MQRPTFAVLTVLALAGPVHAADNCEPIRAEIEDKIREAGVQTFRVSVVDAASDAPGQLVGSCDQGAKKILYSRGDEAPAAGATGGARSGAATGAASAGVATGAAPAGAAPATAPQPRPASAPVSDAVLTECKPGFISIRGECKKL